MYLRLMDEDNTPWVATANQHVWVAMAVCYHSLGDANAAYRAFISCVAADPNCREAWTHFAHIASQWAIYLWLTVRP
jgi:Tfp pilus assembly protein PilF